MAPNRLAGNAPKALAKSGRWRSPERFIFCKRIIYLPEKSCARVQPSGEPCKLIHFILPDRKSANTSFMLHNRVNKLYQALVLVTAILVTTSCTTTNQYLPAKTAQSQPTTEAIILASELEQTGQWQQAHALYLHLAQQSGQPQRSRYLQKAALMLYRAGQYDQIEAFYDALDDNELQPAEIPLRNVLLAAAYLEQGKIYQSLGNLPDIERIQDPAYKALALRIRSQGVLAIGKPLESARLRIQIGQYLNTEDEIRKNQKFIWDALNRISETKILNTLKQQQTPQLRGWLELNLIARRSDMLPAKLEPWLEKWYQRYADHEAADGFAEALLDESRLIYIEPTRIALMLPLDGKLKNVAEAIQDGFLYAYYQQQQPRPALEIINAQPDASDFFLQYNQAIQHGADFIVGPLSKVLVNDLLQTDNLQVPTLTLNYADDANRSTNNLYQFGLRPEDEAEQIADYALNNGKYHAITLTPDTRLGDRLQSAFTKRFETLGGLVVGSQRYPARKNDYSAAIKQLLNINSSNRRHSILDNVLGRKTEFIPRRRQDIDMIFISGNPRQARLIRPQLKFHHALDLPVYATSSISAGTNDPDVDRDLNDILFINTPWALQNTDNPDFVAIASLWPRLSQRYAKFFALGLDAYKLIPSLRRLLINPQEKIPLNSGTVSVDAKGRIHRTLIPATYRRGRVVVLEENTKPE